ncbi:MAG: carotenoid biosynthesis protein [Daejeonella sp.]|uniref:carotenoid biosynthesis protein n=1 Tax=Daejeonella sp. TaxID=2805397 RepID=UPI003C7628ED
MFNKTNICSLIVILFHCVGLYGFLNPELNDFFIKLVPFHLLLMLSLMIVSGYDGTRDILLFALMVYAAGFLVEVAGVNTGLIFGSYTYGSTLGLKLWQTPLMIGVNWLILVYTTGVLLQPIKINKYALAALGAAVLVSTDFLIEPVAIKYDYWSWQGGVIPMQNYIGWFIVAFIMFLFFNRMNFRKQNPAAIVLFVTQLVFFIVLNWWAS